MYDGLGISKLVNRVVDVSLINLCILLDSLSARVRTFSIFSIGQQVLSQLSL